MYCFKSLQEGLDGIGLVQSNFTFAYTMVVEVLCFVLDFSERREFSLILGASLILVFCPFTESGVSSASPSDLGHSEEEGEKVQQHAQTMKHRNQTNNR